MAQERYNPKIAEAKWQGAWNEQGAHHIPDVRKAKNPYYCTPMLPYPSGDKLHVGHWYNYGPTDSWARYMKMKGYDVFEPMGFDAFGLPAENYAIKTGVHPAESIARNVTKMREQLERMGCMYDWERSINTSTPEYYKWTQWLFLQMFEHGLAYQKEGLVNWCPKDQTVLANEQVVDGLCERCDSEVVQKQMKQWYWKTTDYADRLLENLNTLDWPEKTKAMQRNWIGRSEGAEVQFSVVNFQESITVFTTRPDTLFGATYIVLSPEHPLVAKITTDDQRQAIDDYLKKTRSKTELERTALEKEKTGVFTGAYAVSPVNDEKLPIWIADYVLMNYGTGAIMAVPAHDERDYAFAKKFNLPIREVISGGTISEAPHTGDGEIINSNFLNGLDVASAKKKMGEWLLKTKNGKPKTVFRLRDWSVSRQRYWGAPIPIVYDPKGQPHAVPEKHLPWLLPTDVDFKPTGVPPLAKSAELKARTEKLFGAGWTPEVDTMDTFVCSSFYTLRYLNPEDDKRLIDKRLTKTWLPIQMYIGGPEHMTGHLIYARFVHMALHDWGYLAHEEPFQRLIHQGLITHQGAKMSKSKGNVVSPDEFVEQYGSDVFRMYLMFLGPFTDGGDWSDKGITGIDRFVQKAWRLINFVVQSNLVVDMQSDSEKRFTHQSVKKVNDSLEKLQFNTAISFLMEFVNFLSKNKWERGSDEKLIYVKATAHKDLVGRETLETFIKLLAPLAPHLSEELWEQLGNKKSVFEEEWPTYDPKLTIADTVTIAVQVNGKLRATFQVPNGTSDADLISQAKADENVRKFIDGKEIRKEIVVPNKLVNLVVSP